MPPPMDSMERILLARWRTSETGARSMTVWGELSTAITPMWSKSESRFRTSTVAVFASDILDLPWAVVMAILPERSSTTTTALVPLRTSLRCSSVTGSTSSISLL